MIRSACCWLTGLGMLMASSMSDAAQIKQFELPGPITIVDIRGEIVAGDAKRFIEAVGSSTRVSTILRSDGGLLDEALQIGAEIRLRNFATMVPPDSDCHSACALIWVAGARRYMAQTSRIGFHAAYRTRNGQNQESGAGNADVGSFLTHLGLRREAIRYFTSAGPGELSFLTTDKARQLGIEIFETAANGTIVTPDHAPTVDILADRFISLGLIGSRCSELFDLDPAVLKVASTNAIVEGQKIVGPDKWIQLWSPLLDGAKREIASKGALPLCLETEANLRRQGVSIGVNGPSFDCRTSTRSPVERAICSDNSLWAKDRAMNNLYLLVRKLSDQTLRQQFLADQRKWIGVRNACSDSHCLKAAYDDRLKIFSKIDLSQVAR